jgi:thymidylate synthase ThyX
MMALEINIAGMTIDKDGLDEAKALLNKEYTTKEEIDHALLILESLTPETVAASYARISRDPDPIPKLREKARSDVAKARASYEMINFGLGHKSIAEHAVFNFDVMGLSRFAVEAIEEKRLQSYTEKSQRYIMLNGDFVLPTEIAGTPLESEFVANIEEQNVFYKESIDKLLAWHKTRDYSANFASLGIPVDNKKRQDDTLLGYAKEDARYALSMATQAQLGMTLSARNLESLIARLRSSGIEELRQIGGKLFACVDGIAPSIIKYTEPTKYFKETRKELAAHVRTLIDPSSMPPYTTPWGATENVKLFNMLHRDDSNLAALLFGASDIDYDQALDIISELDEDKQRTLRDAADRYQEKHDPKLREYELGDRVAEIVMSASAFAQMKRHRMNTIIAQDYNPVLGHTVPASIHGAGLWAEFSTLMMKSDALYADLLDAGLGRDVATYALTNAHRRRILYDANNRQVHAFGAERLNLPAQWDIRQLANEYVSLVKETSPIMLEKVCGKDQFDETKRRTLEHA